MLRETRRAFILVDRPQDNQEGCEGQDRAVWYPEEGVCLRMFWVTFKNLVEPVDGDLVSKLSAEPYGLDRLEAYKNAYHCWIDNDGNPGHADVEAEIETGEVPPCYFGMVVKSGKWSDKIVVMDDWMGQKNDGMWDPEGERV